MIVKGGFVHVAFALIKRITIEMQRIHDIFITLDRTVRHFVVRSVRSKLRPCRRACFYILI